MVIPTKGFCYRSRPPSDTSIFGMSFCDLDTSDSSLCVQLEAEDKQLDVLGTFSRQGTFKYRHDVRPPSKRFEMVSLELVRSLRPHHCGNFCKKSDGAETLSTLASISATVLETSSYR